MRPVVVTCTHCGEPVGVAATGPIPKYCSAACRRSASHEHSKRDGRYAAELEADRQKRQRRSREKQRPCPYCGTTMDNLRRKQCGKPHCKRAFDAERGREFQRRYKAEHGQWYSGERYGEAQRAYFKERRETQPHWRKRYPAAALMADVRRRMRVEEASTGEAFAPMDVHARDGWTCRLCRLPIDPQVAWPDPMSASVDHIVPLSRGGTHELSNVQSAHLVCNIKKSDQLLNEEP